MTPLHPLHLHARDPFKARGRASGTLQLARAWNHPISILNDLKRHPFFVRVQCILPMKDKILCDMLEKESTDCFDVFGILSYPAHAKASTSDNSAQVESLRPSFKLVSIVPQIYFALQNPPTPTKSHLPFPLLFRLFWPRWCHNLHFCVLRVSLPYSSSPQFGTEMAITSGELKLDP